MKLKSTTKYVLIVLCLVRAYFVLAVDDHKAGVKPPEINPDDQTIAIAFELVNSLDEADKKKAVLSDRFTDMLLGPGKDDVMPVPEGIAAKDLSEAHVTLDDSFETPSHCITTAICVNSRSKQQSSFAHFMCR